MKKWLVRGVGVLVVVGAAAALIAGTALAQDDGFGGPRGHRGKGPRLIPQVAEATGLSAEDVFDELQAGKTAADILTENGVDVNTFTTELLAEMESRLVLDERAGKVGAPPRSQPNEKEDPAGKSRILSECW